MGILNLDPESFFNPSYVINQADAVKKAEGMIEEGMDLLDIGAFSSKPGMKIPSYEVERNRLFPVLKAIRSAFPELIISVDTMRSEIALEAFDSGVEMINDISASDFDLKLPLVVSKNHKIYVAMHMKGRPENMMYASNTNYNHVMNELISYFSEKLNSFQKIGLHKVIIDPGFGFSKKMKDNYTILRNLHYLEILDKPLLVGLSRKSMIWKALHSNAHDALIGTLIAEFYAVMQGCHIIRVHDVKETVQMLAMHQVIHGEPN